MTVSAASSCVDVTVDDDADLSIASVNHFVLAFYSNCYIGKLSLKIPWMLYSS